MINEHMWVEIFVLHDTNHSLKLHTMSNNRYKIKKCYFMKFNKFQK